MSYINMWVYLAWSTGYREPTFTETTRQQVLAFIRAHARTKGILLDEINSFDNYLNCLVLLKPDQSIAQVAKLIKGESASWINQQKLLDSRFSWQRDFFASSVGASDLNKVRLSIQNRNVPFF